MSHCVSALTGDEREQLNSETGYRSDLRLNATQYTLKHHNLLLSMVLSSQWLLVVVCCSLRLDPRRKQQKLVAVVAGRVRLRDTSTPRHTTANQRHGRQRASRTICGHVCQAAAPRHDGIRVCHAKRGVHAPPPSVCRLATRSSSVTIATSSLASMVRVMS